MDFDAIGEQLTKWFGLALGLVVAAWGVRKRISGDSLAVQKNEAEGGWISQMQRERDEAVARERATMAAHMGLLEENAGLRLKEAFAVERLERLEKELRLIKRLLLAERPDLAALLNTGFSELNDAPERGGL